MFAVSSFARMRHVLHGLQVVHLRVFMVYGPGQSARTKLVPYAITSLLQEARLKLFERYPPRRLGLSRDEASPRLAAPNNTRRRLRSTVDWYRADLEGTHSLTSVCPRPTRRMHPFTVVRLRGGRPSRVRLFRKRTELAVEIRDASR
jgi:hypothetical protein